MSKKVLAVFVVVLMLVLVSSVAIADEKPPPIDFELGSSPPSCQVVEHPTSPYAVLCKDDNIVKVKVEEAGIFCDVTWDATSMSLVVTDEPSKQAPQRWNPGRAFLIWWVYDADGNVTLGFYSK